MQWLVGFRTAGRPKLRVRAAMTKFIAVIAAKAEDMEADMVAVAVAMTTVAVEGWSTPTKFASLTSWSIWVDRRV